MQKYRPWLPILVSCVMALAAGAAASATSVRAISKRFTPPAVMLRYALAMGLNGEPAESTRSLRLLCQIWPEKNCTEGREAWVKLSAQFPQLHAVPFPMPPKDTAP